MDDDYLNVYEYVGEEKHEYTVATNISKEEHEMKKMASPQEIKIHQQTQLNPSSTDTHGFQKQAQEGAFKKTIKDVIFTVLIILAVSVSLAAIVLSILSYNSHKIEQSDTNLVISKITDNVTNVAIKIDNIKSVASTAEFNIFQLSSQLNETNNSISPQWLLL